MTVMQCCADPMRGRGHCHLCHEEIESRDVLGHVRVMHPDVYGDGPECWPDGGLVIEVDPDPADFEAS